MSTEKFIQGQMYELVDKEGFQKRFILNLSLAIDIMTSGKVIIPISVDSFGNVMGVEFGDGKIDTSVRIWSACRKFFREVGPLPVLAAMQIPVKSASVKLTEPLAA